MKVNFKDRRANIIVAITTFLVSIILVAVLAIQFKTIDEVNETDIENLRETELREQLSTWKGRYEDIDLELKEIKAKIEEYRGQINAKDVSSELLDSELKQTEMLLGKTRVRGEGVRIILEDNEKYPIKASDLLELLNELRFGGAEAISINGIRVLSTTDIVDIGNQFILMKPSQRIASPYIVEAIGTRTYLSSTLNQKNSGFIDSYKNSGREVRLEEDENLILPAYAWNIDVNYMKEVTE